MRVRFAYFFLLLTLFTVTLSSCSEDEVASASSEPSTAFDSHLEKATQIADSGHLEQSLRYLDSVYNNGGAITVMDKYYYFQYYYNIYNRYINDHDQAFKYTDSMLALAKRANSYYAGRIMAETNYARGDLFFAKGNYEEAYEYLYKAKTYAAQSLDSCSLSDYSYRLGMVLYKQKRYKLAANYFKNSYKESRGCANNFVFFYRKQELLDNIALCYSKIDLHDSAILYFNKALLLIESEKHNFPAKNPAVFATATAVIYGNMGDIYLKRGEADMAESMYRESIEINRQKWHDNNDAQRTKIKLASLLLSNKNFHEAWFYLEDVKTILDTLPENNVRRDWYDLMSQYYDQTGHRDVAFNYLLAHKKLDDTITRVNRRLIQTDVNEHFKHLDTQYQVDILEKNNDLKRILLMIMVAGAILSLIFFGYVYFNWRRSKLNVAQLTRLNKQICSQNKTLESVLAELETIDKEKDRILRVVAHDIRNPIAAIMSLTDFIMTEDERLSKKKEDYAELIQEACSNALTLTKNILEASNPNQTENSTREHVCINSLLGKCVSLLRLKAAEKEQNIVFVQSDEPLCLNINKEQIWRVINNLVVNAIKFSNNGDDIVVKARQEDQNVIICVTDHGIGIPEANKSKIFDMFTEAKRYGTAGEKPFGLGLSICRQIIEGHDGKITFESTEGKGTTFCITLPITEDINYAVAVKVAEPVESEATTV